MELLGYIPFYGSATAIPLFKNISPDFKSIVEWMNENGGILLPVNTFVGSSILQYENIEGMGLGIYEHAGGFDISSESYSDLSSLFGCYIASNTGDKIWGLTNFLVREPDNGKKYRFGSQDGYDTSDNLYKLTDLWLERYDNVKICAGFISDTLRLFGVHGNNVILAGVPHLNNDSKVTIKDLQYFPSYDEASNIAESAPKPIELYLSSPKLPIYTKRGESIQLEFSIKISDGSILENVPFTYQNSQPDATGITNWVIEGSTLTFTNECYYALSWIKFRSEVYPELDCVVEFHITDPMPQPNLPGPYLPDGGNGSTSSNTVTGTFDAQPGPSIVENLPNGSSGADIASSGMYTKYLCNNALLNLLAEFFWEDNVGIQALKAVLGNPIDSIISLAAYPFALDTLVPKTATTIYFGQYDSHFSAFSLTKSSFQIDWGTVTIPFFWGSFLDYSPYTKIQLYLPWGVGFVSIDPNEVVPWSRKNTYNKADFVNGTIRVITNIELDKGACVHNIVGNNGRVIGSFGGVVGKQVPVTGSDNSARILAMMSAAISSSAAVGMSAGGAVAAGKNLAYGKGMTMAERAEGHETIGNYKSSVGGAIQSLSGAIASPPSYPRAGTFSDATNTLGYQYPYLIISRPSQSVPQQYGRFMGYPSNIFHAHLGEVRGYTEVSSIHLDKITATANELDELESILKGGVLL